MLHFWLQWSPNSPPHLLETPFQFKLLSGTCSGSLLKVLGDHWLGIFLFSVVQYSLFGLELFFIFSDIDFRNDLFHSAIMKMILKMLSKCSKIGASLFQYLFQTSGTLWLALAPGVGWPVRECAPNR